MSASTISSLVSTVFHVLVLAAFTEVTLVKIEVNAFSYNSLCRTKNDLTSISTVPLPAFVRETQSARQQRKIRQSILYNAQSPSDRGDNYDDGDIDESDDSMLDELRTVTSKMSYFGSLFSQKNVPRPIDVHIILFCPDTDNEGVHTIEFPKGSGNNVILAFESQTECNTFASALKEQNFFDPAVSTLFLLYT